MNKHTDEDVKHIHVRANNMLFSEFSIICFKFGVKKQQAIEWFLQSVAEEDPRAIDLIKELSEAKDEHHKKTRRDKNILSTDEESRISELEIENLRNLLGK